MPTLNLGRVGFVNKGAYIGGTTAYKINDIVVYNSGIYACIQAHSTSHLPTDILYWQKWTGSTADTIANTPAGNISSVTVQGAINELDAEKQALSPNYTGVKAVSLASASVVDIGAATGDFIHITGTTTITSFGTVAAGVKRTLIFDGSLTITYNVTSMILPYGVDVVTTAGDSAVFVSEGSGNWKCVSSKFTNETLAGLKNFTGNITLGGAGQRIISDFSNATVSSRTMFQSLSTNTNTRVGVIPNGTSNASFVEFFGASDPNNTSVLTVGNAGTETRVASGVSGAGSVVPLSLYCNGLIGLQIDTAGNALVKSSGNLGYGTGSGGTVTQATSKSTAVTLNKPSGQVTMNNAALAASTVVSFTLNNSNISSVDTISFSFTGAVSYSNYNIWCVVGAGAATIFLRNISAGSLSEAVQFNFSVIKGAAS